MEHTKNIKNNYDMKTRLGLLVMALMLSLGTADLHAQGILREVGRGVARRAVNRAERKVVNKINQEVDKAVDKAMDKAIDKAEKKVQAAADTLAQAAEEAAVAFDDASLSIDLDDEPEASAPKGISPEVKARFAARPSGGKPFYPMKEGMVLTYASKTTKGETDSYSRMTITKIDWKDENNYTVETSTELLDAERNVLSTAPLTAGVIVEDGIVSFDPTSMAGLLTEGMQVSGDNFYLPDNIEVGDQLPDYKVVVTVGGLKTTSDNTSIKVTGKETLTVSGHAIDCYIIESSVSAKAIGIKSEMKQKVWYGRGIGQVKTEGYSKKGKLMSVNELVEVTGL